MVEVPLPLTPPQPRMASPPPNAALPPPSMATTSTKNATTSTKNPSDLLPSTASTRQERTAPGAHLPQKKCSRGCPSLTETVMGTRLHKSGPTKPENPWTYVDSMDLDSPAKNGTAAGIYDLRLLKIKRCAELDGAARLRLTFAMSSPVKEYVHLQTCLRTAGG